MTEFAAARDGVRIAYEVIGEGPPVLLIHGFGSDRNLNWRWPGWYDGLNRAGYSAVALDCRGHGESDKPHDPADYDEAIMIGDVLSVMDAAGHTRATVMGYSMGGYITVRLMREAPERMERAIIAGVGGVYFTRDKDWRGTIADGILAGSEAGLSRVQRMFRAFARQPGKDPIALAACMRSPRTSLSREQLAAIRTPALVVCGGADEVSGPADPLAAALGNARAVIIPNRDHMRTVGDKVYKDTVLDFLRERAPQKDLAR
jgi:pimeloyl-ACP methyl ester carboxylesterase